MVYDAFAKERIADKFLEVFKRDIRKGYTKGFYEMLSKSNTGSELLSNIHGDSTNNGSAMRVIPLGFFDNESYVLEMAELQAKVTHDSDDGILGAKVIALSSFLLRNGVPRNMLLDRLNKRLNTNIKNQEIERCGMNSLDTARASIALVLQCNSQREIVNKGVLAGGDTDTVLAIACGLSTLCDDIENDLDGFFDSELENGVYGYDYFMELDEKLAYKYPLIKI